MDKRGEEDDPLFEPECRSGNCPTCNEIDQLLNDEASVEEMERVNEGLGPERGEVESDA